MAHAFSHGFSPGAPAASRPLDRGAGGPPPTRPAGQRDLRRPPHSAAVTSSRWTGARSSASPALDDIGIREPRLRQALHDASRGRRASRWRCYPTTRRAVPTGCALLALGLGRARRVLIGAAQGRPRSVPAGRRRAWVYDRGIDPASRSVRSPAAVHQDALQPPEGAASAARGASCSGPRPPMPGRGAAPPAGGRLVDRRRPRSASSPAAGPDRRSTRAPRTWAPTTRTATWNTNQDPAAWLTLAGTQTFYAVRVGRGRRARPGSRSTSTPSPARHRRWRRSPTCRRSATTQLLAVDASPAEWSCANDFLGAARSAPQRRRGGSTPGSQCSWS